MNFETFLIKIRETSGYILRESYFEKNYLDLYKEVKKYEYIINEHLCFKELLYLFLMRMKNVPKCKTCKKNTKFLNFSNGYQEFCCIKCSNKNNEKIEKTKLSYIKHFNVDNPAKHDNVKEKINQTMLDKYGSHCLSNKIVRNKISKTRNLNTESISLKIQNARHDTFKIRYDKKLKPDYTLMTYTNSYNITVRCEKCKQIFLSNYFKINNHFSHLCPYCFKRHHSSFFEYDAFDKLKKENPLIKIELNNRTALCNKKELDIFIPIHNIAFEINGIRWHTSDRLGIDYHLRKSLRAFQKNIQLVHVFTDEIQYSNNDFLTLKFLNKKLILEELNVFCENFLVGQFEIYKQGYKFNQFTALNQSDDFLKMKKKLNHQLFFDLSKMNHLLKISNNILPPRPRNILKNPNNRKSIHISNFFENKIYDAGLIIL